MKIALDIDAITSPESVRLGGQNFVPGFLRLPICHSAPVDVSDYLGSNTTGSGSRKIFASRVSQP